MNEMRTSKILVTLIVGICCLGAPRGASPEEAAGRTLVAVFAHADDEFLVAPLLARYAREGADVHLVIATRGEKWAPQTDLAPGDEIAAVRAAEARCAGERLGIHPPVLLSFDDGSLGERVRPPWATLARLEEELTELFRELSPDAIVTWGPDGGYGHPEHRLVGAVVTQLVQRRAEGAPEALLYVGIPAERLPEEQPPGGIPWQGTAMEYLTVQVPYSPADFEAVKASFACYRSQFPEEALEVLPLQAQQVWQGRVFLRPWFGAARGDDLFALSPRGE